MKKIALVLFICLMNGVARSQVVYEDINNTAIYDFLDELADLKIISLNSVIKPYPRAYIAGKLYEALEADNVKEQPADKSPEPHITISPIHHLNSRLRKELMFYLQDFQLDGKRLRFINYELRITKDTSSIQHPATPGVQMKENYNYRLGFLPKNQNNMVVALNPLGFHYRDSLFTFSFRPILGFQWMTNKNGADYHRWWGGSMSGYIGNHFGFYASLRDNNESVPLALPLYFTREQGAVYKNLGNGAVDFSEMKGCMVASVRWGSLGIVIDRMEWGDNYHGSNIISGKAPAFPYIMLHLNPVKWFDFNYMHGWLNSNIIDSSRSYPTGNVYRIVYRNKYIAANMYTLIPWRGLNFSFGNSIIYSDISVHPLYFIPFLFFNAADATRNNYSNNAGSNSQLFFNISSRQIRYLHLFLSLYIDEWKMSRLMKKDQHNFTSLKAGFRLANFPVQNLTLTSEYTRTQPMTYDHYIPATTFASNDYTLGSYLRENSQEIYVSLSWHLLRGVLLTTSYTLAQHGYDVPYRYDAGYAVDKVPFLNDITWQNNSIEISARYEFVNNGYFFIQYLNAAREGDIRYQPAFMNGMTNTLMTGINIGF